MGNTTIRLVWSIVVVLPAAACLLCGCPWQVDVEGNPAPRSPDDNGNGSRENPPPTVRLIVSLRTMTVLVPSGSLDRSADFWPLLDESRLGLRQREMLAGNGLRVGVGRPEFLDRVKKAILASKALNQSETSVAMITGDPVLLPAAKHPTGQTIFLKLSDGGLSGLSFRKSTNLFRVACAIQPSNLEDVVFDVVPEVRFRKRRQRLTPGPGGMLHRLPYSSRLLIPARCKITIPKEHFFVIAPGRRADVKLTVGHQFLRSDRDGKPYDTIIILAFAVVRRSANRWP